MRIPHVLTACAAGGFLLLAIAAAILLAATPLAAQQRYPVDPAFEKRIDQLMGFLQSCDVGGNEAMPTACNIFAAKALDVLYDVRDFGPDSQGKYYLAAVVRASLPDKPAWTQIGTADSPAVIDNACILVQTKSTPIIAVSPGHVVIVLPGPCARTSWGENVPLVASYFLNKPLESAFIGLPISKAWPASARADVQIWVRNTR